MRLFLDSSVLLAASGSASGAARLLFNEATVAGWSLVTSDYCLRETEHNVSKLGASGLSAWCTVVRPALTIHGTHLVLDRDDFHDLLGNSSPSALLASSYTRGRVGTARQPSGLLGRDAVPTLPDACKAASPRFPWLACPAPFPTQQSELGNPVGQHRGRPYC